MTGLFETRRQQERRRTKRRLLTILFIISIVGAIAGGFHLGRQEQVGREDALQAEIDTLTNAQTDLVAGLAQVQARADAAQDSLRELEARYREDVPNDDIMGIARLAQQRLAAGIPLDRLTYVLQRVDEQDDCDTVDVKRFRPTTRLTPANTSDNIVSFANGAVQIMASGEEDADPETGNPVSWYNPDKPVAITVGLIDGSQLSIAGELPINHREVRGDDEHRLIFSQGPRSFMLVTYQRCPFP